MIQLQLGNCRPVKCVLAFVMIHQSIVKSTVVEEIVCLKTGCI